MCRQNPVRGRPENWPPSFPLLAALQAMESWAGPRNEASLMPRPHLAHARRRGLVSQVQILGPAEVLKPCNNC